MESAISLKEKASYGIGAIGKDMACGIIYTYLMLYFTDVVGVSAAFVGMIFLVARIWDAVNDPIMGWIVDNTKTRWGKFRPWILIGTLINSVIVLCLFYNPAQFLGSTGVMVYCAVFYILWGMSYTIMDIPYWSMIPSFSSDAKVRDIMSVIPRTCAMFGGQFVAIFGLPLIAFFGVNMGGTESDGFFRYTMLIVAIFIVAEIICVTNVREHVQTPLRQKISIKGMLSLLVRNDQLLVIILLTIILQLAQNLFNGAVLYYFKYALMNEDAYPYFMGTGAVAQLLSFVCFPKLVQLTSRKTMYILSVLGMIVGYVGMFIFGSDANSNLYVTGFFWCLVSFGIAVSNVCTTVMLADTVDYGEFKLGTRSESIVFSMQTMTVKFGTALAGFMTGVTLAIVGYVPNAVQSESTLLGLRLVMFIASAAIMFIMLLVYLKCYKLNGEFYKNVLSALEVSRSKARADKEALHKVHSVLPESCVLIGDSFADKKAAMHALASAINATGCLKDLKTFEQALDAREAQAPTGMGKGIAIPHAKSPAVRTPCIAAARVKTPLDFGAPDGKLCNLIFMIATPDGNAHLDLIGRLALLLNNDLTVEKLRGSTTPEEFRQYLYIAEKKLGSFVKTNA